LQAGLLFGLAGGGLFAATYHTEQTAILPWRPELLSPNVVTLVSADDRNGIKSAIASLMIAEPLRAEIERAVIERKRRIGWIVFTDSIDPDGDTIAVEAAGLSQQIVLTKSWTPVAVVLDEAPIRVTGVRDGESGGITIAFATSAGMMPLRIIQPGEQIEVVP
jgi:hypothetical protein